MTRFRRAIFGTTVTLAIGAVLITAGSAVPAHATGVVTTVEETSPTVQFTGDWHSSKSPSDSGGSIAFLYSTGSVSMQFTGTSIALMIRTTPSSGISEVVIDQRAVATVDQYSAAVTYRQLAFESAALTPGTHSISVRRTGSRNPASSGTNVVLDAFIVGDSTKSPVTLPVVGTGVHEDTAPAISFSGVWRDLASGSDSGGGSRYLNAEGSASLAFTGKAVAWVSRLSASAGIADVYLDDVKVATVDRYSATDVYQKTVFERRDLTDAPHVIRVVWTGRANARSGGTNLLVDNFSVRDIDPPAQPSATRGDVYGGKLVVAWEAVAAADLAGYRIYDVSSGSRKIFGQATKYATTSTFVGLQSGQTIKVAVSAVDTAGNESALSPVASMTTGATPAGSQRYRDCPTAGTTVSTVAQLKTAIAAATPGTSIRLAPGTYPGQQISIIARGTATKPVWICGPRTAIIDGGSISAAHGILVSSSSYVVVSGMTVRNFLKGVTVRSSDHITVSDVAIDTIGYEGLHLRENTTDTVVVGNTIAKTGRLDPFYGEGVYIGSSSSNWCALTGCQPDRSDRNTIMQNSITATGSDPIEAKEGTSGGVIAGNILDGTNAMMRAEAWVKVGGNNWTVTSNRGTNSTLNGFRIQGRGSEWGMRNVFTDNSATINAAGYGFELYEPAGPGTTSTIVSCSNIVAGAAKGHSNTVCAP